MDAQLERIREVPLSPGAGVREAAQAAAEHVRKLDAPSAYWRGPWDDPERPESL